MPTWCACSYSRTKGRLLLALLVRILLIIQPISNGSEVLFRE